MTVTAGYEIPDGSLPQSSMQEEISLAYVHMVASAAGLTLVNWSTDYGAVDVTLKSLVDYGCVGGYQPSFDLQLKATIQDLGTGDTFNWSVNRRTHEKLSADNRSIPAIFAVLSLPRDPVMWLTHDIQGLVSHSHLYWIRAWQMPPIVGENQSVSVTIDKKNIFSPANVLELMREASEWWLR